MKTPTIVLLTLCILALSASEAPAPTRRMEDFGDFIGNYNFRLEIEGVDAGQFTAVDGLSIEQEVIEYQNGDDPLTRKRPGRVKYGNITLKRGYVARSSDSSIQDWFQLSLAGSPEQRNAVLTLQALEQKTLVPVSRWQLSACFPIERSISTEYERRDYRILVETIRLSCDEVVEQPVAPPT